MTEQATGSSKNNEIEMESDKIFILRLTRKLWRLSDHATRAVQLKGTGPELLRVEMLRPQILEKMVKTYQCVFQEEEIDGIVLTISTPLLYFVPPSIQVKYKTNYPREKVCTCGLIRSEEDDLQINSSYRRRSR